MTLLIGAVSNSIFDEQNWGSDIFLRSSLHTVQSGFYSLGTITNSLDRDYYQFQVLAGASYTISMTSDSSRYGWNAFSNSSFLEFDIVNNSGFALLNSTISGVYDDTLTFTANASGAYYIDVHGLSSGAADYALTISSNVAPPNYTYYSSVSHTLGNGYLDLVLNGQNNINGTGNSYANIITGNTGKNILSGLAGNDTLFGGDGSDLLGGGTGNDNLDGGRGADFLMGGAGKDRISGGLDQSIDVFIFDDRDSAKGTNRDTAINFKSGIDDLELSLLDGNTTMAGDQSFAYKGLRA